MDVAGISAAASAGNVDKATNVATEVHKKSLEIQEQAATDLIAGIPDPDSSVGQNIDIKV